MGSQTEVYDEDLFSGTFPDDVPCATLQRLSLRKLLDRDPDQLSRMISLMKKEGFFYLDLLDCDFGVRLYDDACNAARVGKQVFPNNTIEEKRVYKAPPKTGIFDRGYVCTDVTEHNEPTYAENFNVPQSELFAKQPTGWKLPGYLENYEPQFKGAMESGNKLANIVLGCLEQELQLDEGTLTSMHQLHDDSSDFLRMLRYPGVSERTVDWLGFPAHTDALSLAILFTWHGGLQVPKDGAKMLGQYLIAEEDWLWIKPERGCAIINIGDAMELFTNGLLHSGLHRVIRAPGSQAPYDKYSVLIGTRPRLDVPMKPFSTPVIPAEQPSKLPEEMNSKQWGTYKIDILNKTFQKRRDNNIFTAAGGGETVRAH